MEKKTEGMRGHSHLLTFFYFIRYKIFEVKSQFKGACGEDSYRSRVKF